MAYRILAIDGGGIRGILPAIVLERLAADDPARLARVDLIAGTSTGGIMALGLAAGMSPTQLRELYEVRGAVIFDDSWLDNLLDLGKMIGAAYDNNHLRRELKKVFGSTRLGDLNHHVLIPSFDLDNEAADEATRSWKPKLFHNFSGPGNDCEELVWKVALYTSAAPTYFPSVDGYVDGGVYASNPSMCALAQALDRRYMAPPPSIGDLRLLSLGTGQAVHYIRKKTIDWGYAQWAKLLIPLMYDGVTGTADYQCRQILGPAYHRLAPTLPAGQTFPLDGVARLPDLIAIAAAIDLEPVTDWLEAQGW